MKKIYVFNLNPLNLLLCLILSFKYELIYFKSEFINNFFLGFFKKLTNSKKLNHKFRNYISDIAHNKINKNFNKEIKFFFKLNNQKISIQQSFKAEIYELFESYTLFSTLIKESNPVFMINNVNIEIFKKIFNEDSDREKIIFYKISLCLDLIWITIKKIILSLKIFYNLAKNLFKNDNSKIDTDFFIIDISAKNLVNGSDKKNINYITKLIRCKNKKEFFYFEEKLNSSQIKYLKQNRINFLYKNQIFTKLTLKEKLLTLKELFFLNKLNLKQNLYRNLMTIKLLQHFDEYLIMKKIKKFILLGNNSNIPSSGILFDICRNLKQLSVIWNYSQCGTLVYENKKNSYARIQQSIIYSDLYLVWSETDRKLILERNLNGDTFNVSITGPMMLGDPNWVLQTSLEAQKKYFINSNSEKKYVCIFDLDSKIDNFLSRIPASFQDKFFLDMLEIIKKFNNLNFIYKPKVIKETTYLGKVYKDFLNYKSDNFTIFQNNIDPYIPISISNFIIAMPYTSSLHVGLYFNRNAIYYDPLDHFKNPYPPINEKYRITDKNKLVQKLSNLDKNTDNFNKEKINPFENFIKIIESKFN